MMLEGNEDSALFYLREAAKKELMMDCIISEESSEIKKAEMLIEKENSCSRL